MKVLGINGSHRAGKGTAALLQAALDGAAEQGTALGVPVSWWSSPGSISGSASAATAASHRRAARSRTT